MKTNNQIQILCAFPEAIKLRGMLESHKASIETELTAEEAEKLIPHRLGVVEGFILIVATSFILTFAERLVNGLIRGHIIVVDLSKDPPLITEKKSSGNFLILINKDGETEEILCMDRQDYAKRLAEILKQI